MERFLLFCMGSIGLTAILVDGKIFQPFREMLERNVAASAERFEKMRNRPSVMPRTWSGFLLAILTCYQCCGFWSGLFCGLFLTTGYWSLPRLTVPLVVYIAFFELMCGFAGSFLAVVYIKLLDLIHEKTMLCIRTHPVPHDHNHVQDDHESMPENE
ncbi:MAG: DUF1360 domain-containing protein [Planctomycetaceae bacterium]|nr:DUF1360 domain-containing protein [Planctomycetaceae bacterium]